MSEVNSAAAMLEHCKIMDEVGETWTQIKVETLRALAAECERVRAANLDCVDRFNQAMAARDAALAELAALKGGREWPDDEIVSAWKWCEENGGTPAEFLSYSLLTKRARLLGRPLTWREAIELTHATTDMPDEQRDKLLAMDDAPPAQASAWVAEGLRELLAEMVDLHNRRGVVLTVHMDNLASLLAAPTPGASDGKEGE